MSDSSDCASSPAPSRLLGGERRTIRFEVSPQEGKRAEFFCLDRARLHAWALALDGHTVQISKVIYNTIPSPAVALSWVKLEEWDERSAFLILNANLSRTRPPVP